MRPPDEVRKEIVRQWLARGQESIEAAAVLLSRGPLFHPSCLQSQQAAEMYIKAFLTWHQVEFSQARTLDELLGLVGKADKALAVTLGGVTALSAYGMDAWPADEAPEPTRAQAEDALNLARGGREAVLKALPPLGVLGRTQAPRTREGCAPCPDCGQVTAGQL